VAPTWGESSLSRLTWVTLVKRILAAFTDHPASVSETYWQHARHSAKFGITMLRGPAAAFVHAMLPALCTTTGSRIIARLHDRMILNRIRFPLMARETPPCEYIADHI
jgi:Family of unknown function (DUF6356)